MIEVQDLELKAGRFHLRGLRMRVESGRYAVLMGRTGAGKTKLLEAICGLHPVLAGAVRVGEQDVTGQAPAERGVGYVPQDGALFPTLTVREHLAFAPQVRGDSASQVSDAVGQWSSRLGLEPLLDRRPRGLSGGERQKVALGRALAARPKALLLDEPLAALDEESWSDALALLRAVHSESGVTVLHVTHRQAEADAVADAQWHLADGSLGCVGDVAHERSEA